MRSGCKVNRDDGNGDGVHDIGFLTLNTTSFAENKGKFYSRCSRNDCIGDGISSELTDGYD